MYLGLNRLPLGVKYRLKQIGRRLGLEINLNDLDVRADLRLAHLLNTCHVDVLLDVGANQGQFALEAFDAGYSGHIVSFEPLPTAHEKLIKAAKDSGRSWEVAPRMALSDRSGSAQFQITESDTSSSLLEPTESFTQALPAVRVVDRIYVQTERLDEIATRYISEAKNPFLKIDVQGHEKSVLEGSQNTLPRLKGVLIETCTEPLYSNQSHLIDILGILSGAGFEIWDIVTAYRNPKTFRLGAIDILAFRPAADTAASA